jgi:hypothetical protein
LFSARSVPLGGEASYKPTPSSALRAISRSASPLIPLFSNGHYSMKRM